MAGASFQNCRFESITFLETSWSAAHFTDCRFINCNLSLVKLLECRFHNVLFKECKLVGLSFYKCDKRFFSVGFDQCIIQGCNFSDVKMPKTDFKKCKIRETFFTNTDLTEANFSESDFNESIFHACLLSKANFVDAKNYAIDLQTNSVKKAKFSLPEAINLLKSFDLELS